MVCVLLNNDDAPALWLSRSLQHSGRKNIQLISAEELVYAPFFRCGFQNGRAFFYLQLQSGFIFSNQTVSSVINRIQQLPLQHIQSFKMNDREYASTELNAVFVFLFSLFPNNIFNETTVRGFCGKRRSLLEWTILAQQSGFKTTEIIYQNNQLQNFINVENNTLQCILVFNEKCYGRVTNNFPQAAGCCLSLGKLCNEKILEIWFYEQDEEIFFVSALTQPSFKNVTPDFINDINNLL